VLEPLRTDGDAGPGPRPLADLRILDFSRVVAGPFATRMMSDLGADVLKVEPPDGDVTRFWGRSRAGLSGFYTQQNAGKRNICVDLKAEGARELLLDLARRADMVVENYRPGVLDRLGLGYEALRSVNPAVIMLSISGFGQDSSQAGRASYAPIIHAESGLMERQAHFDEAPPSDPMLSIADTNAALHGLVALLSALHLRHRTGQGQHIDLAMVNAMAVTDDYAHFALDSEPARRLGGHVHATGYGHILVAGDLRSQWFQLSRGGLVSDGLAADAPVETKAEVRQRIIAQFFGGWDSRDELVAALDKANLAWADIRPAQELFDSDLGVERRLTVEVDARDGATRRVVESPYRFSEASAGIRGPAPWRGEHNAEALGDWLGLGADEVDRLTGAGVLHRDVPEDRA
jgi:crotonobetainyl-CoA:carnitine CoA-transferase CaiB-like acyl-CoA transferase